MTADALKFSSHLDPDRPDELLRIAADGTVIIWDNARKAGDVVILGTAVRADRGTTLEQVRKRVKRWWQ